MMPALIACALIQASANDAEAWRLFDQSWESWPSAADTFRRDGADPGPRQALSPPGNERFELLTRTDFPNLRHIVGGRMVPVTDPLASAQQLIEVRLNAASYDFIRSRQLYTVAGQRRAVLQGPVLFPTGAIQLKAGWRPISEHERPRYHTLTLRFADGSTHLYGLTALNVAEKTGKGWLWASFEHTDAEGAVHYRLRGTQTTYLDAFNKPVLLGNAVLEAGLGTSASCMTCHARATLSRDGAPARLPVFAPAPAGVRRGYVGSPDPGWFGATYASLDFVWSLSQAAGGKP